MVLSVKEREIICKTLDSFALNYRSTDNIEDKSSTNFLCYSFIEKLCKDKPDWEMYIKYYNDMKEVRK